MLSRKFVKKHRGRRWLAALGTAFLLGGVLGAGNVAMAAKPVDTVAIDLDQCRNGGLADPQTTVQQCVTTGSGSAGWVNGNAGASNAHFAEGESISYRARLTNLPASPQAPAQVTVVLGYDVVHNGHDAIDYLTDKNRWQQPETTVTANPDRPCSGVSGCNDVAPFTPTSTIAIDPPETNIQVDTTKSLASGDCQKAGSLATQQPLTSFTAVAGAGQAKMELFGGTPSGDSFKYVGTTPTLLDKNGDQEQQVQVTFSATQANPVLAWGGHIASRLDWGCTDGIRSASGISGSPYHMRIKSAIVNGNPVSLGNQDRSLSASAVIFFNPGITTTLSATAGAIGDTFHDSATLTGATGTAGGTVKYTVYTDSSCSTFADVGAGASLANAGSVTVTNGVVPNSNNITFNHAGTYYWQAVYSGDGFNATATSVCTSEIVTISPTSPALVTALVPTSILNTGSVTDTATLSGATSGDTQPITISVYSGTGSSACVAANFVTSKTATPATSGNGDYAATFSGLAAGHYEFQATITADGDNAAASSVCGTEPLTVKNAPGATTAQSLYPNDSFTLTGAAGTPSGTVDFYLFPPGGASCGLANINASGVLHFTGTLSSGTASTANTTVSVAAIGTYTWYDSWAGDTLNNAAASNCVETFSIITNG